MHTYNIYDQEGRLIPKPHAIFVGLYQCDFYKKILDRLPNDAYGIIRTIIVEGEVCYVVREKKNKDL